MKPDKNIKVLNIIFSILFICFLVAPTILMVFKKAETVAVLENRFLASAPVLPRSFKDALVFPDKFEKYFKDNLGFRNSFIHSYSLFKLAIGDSPGYNLICGKGSWLFLKDDYYLHNLWGVQNNLKSVSWRIKAIGDKIIKRNDWFKKAGVHYLFVIVPDKCNIYSEYMPDRFDELEYACFVDALLDYLRSFGDIIVLDLRKALLKEKYEGRDVFLKSDSHCNDYGNNVIQYEIVKEIEKVFPNKISPKKFQLTDFTVKNSPDGDLARFSGLPQRYAENVPVCRDASLWRLRQENLALSDVSPRVLFLGDSFGMRLKKYFKCYFRRFKFLEYAIGMKAIKRAVKAEKVDVVVEERSERRIVNLLFEK